MSHKALYSVIQYCPDSSRLEAANIGVLLFCSEIGFVRARTSSSNRRPKRFFGTDRIDNDRLNAAKRAIENRVNAEPTAFGTEEDLLRFVATRGNDIVLTPPRPMTIVDPDRDFDTLFDEVVETQTSAVVPSVQNSIALEDLDRIFRKPSIAPKVTFDYRVEIPIIGRQVEIPYAFRNGCLNLVKPQEFASKALSAERTAMELAVEGDLLYRYSPDDEPRKLVVVALAAKTDRSAADLRVVERIFGEYKVRIVRQSDLDSFAAEIEATAK